MKKKIFSFIIVEIINIICAFMLIYKCDTKFLGVGFSYDLNGLAFCLLSFCALMLLLQNYDTNLLCEGSIAFLMRISKRHCLAIYEILIRIAVIILHEITEIASFLLFSVLLNKSFNLFELMIYFLLLIAVDLFYALLLLLLQLSKNYGFIVICALHIILLFVGVGISKAVNEGVNARSEIILNTVNKFNVSNYISMERAGALVDSYSAPMLIIFAAVIFEALIFIYKCNKIDIIRKE